MFTFGRDHEKTCEAKAVRNPEQVPMLMAVIDSVHDLIEGKGTEEALMGSLRVAFTLGGRDVWERAERWLRLSSREHPSLLQLWAELAAHPKAEIRFRVACYLDDLPQPVFASLAEALANDKSTKVSNMARERIQEVRQRSAT